MAAEFKSAAINSEPLAIIGISCIFPRAQTLREYWANIRNEIDAISEIPATHWNPEDYYDADPKKPDHTYSKRGGFIPEISFDPTEFGISPATLEATDVSQLTSLIVAQGALIDAGYGPKREFDRSKVNVILGLTGTLQLAIPLGARLGHPIWRKALKAAGVDDAIAAQVMSEIGDAYVSWQENSFPGLLGNVAAGRVANRLDLGGTNCIVDAACGSSLGALHMAAMELELGMADMAITGGVDMFNDIFMYMCFSKTQALSASGDAKPFSVDADGTTLGEGVGMVVLKRLSKAQADGDKIYALIKSVGTSSDGRGKSIYAPSVEGQERALRRAYERAGVSPQTIGLVEAHGTGTKVGDEIEIKALRKVFGDAPEGRSWCGIGSVKSMIGHTKAAAGAAGLIKAAMALYNKTLPPTIKVKEPAEIFKDSKSPFYLLLEKRPWLHAADHPRRAAVSAFGFGGSNYHAVLEEYGSSRNEIDWDGNAEIIAISGDSLESVKSSLEPFTKALSASELRLKAAATRRNFKANQPFRLLFAFDPHTTKLPELANSAYTRLSENNAPERFSMPEGVWYETGSVNAPIGVVFPGQGSQYVGMCRDLCCLMPETFSSVASADAVLGEIIEGKRLGDLIYPPKTFDPNLKKAQEETLKETNIAQPSMAAVSIGSFRALEKFGIRPNAVVGHSFGELPALCAAGVYDEPSLFKLAKKRGELMGNGTGDRGGMIAVSLSAAETAEIIASEKLDLIIANYNSPAQMVLSGATSEIKRAAEIFKSKKIRATILQVAGAFHSRFVADAAVPFRQAVGEVEIHQPQFAVYSNTTGVPYPTDSSAIADLLGNQLANPVKFIDCIEGMYDSGIRLFIEVAPAAKMLGLVKAIIGTRPFYSIGIDASAGKKPGSLDLAKTLAICAALGHNINLSLWEDGEKALKEAENARKPGMTIKLTGMNYRSPRPQKSASSAPKPAVTVPRQNSANSVPKAASQQQQEGGVKPSENTAQQPQQNQMMQNSQCKSSTPSCQANSRQTSKMEDHLKSKEQNMTAPAAPNHIQASMLHTMLDALNQMQIQTANLHEKFLEGQEQAQKTLQMILNNLHAPAATQNIALHSKAAPTPIQPVFASNLDAAAMLNAEKAQSTCEASPRVSQPQSEVSIAQAIQKPVFQSSQSENSAKHSSEAPASTAQSAKIAESTSAAADASNVTPVILQIVSEKTGYPTDMLNIDMDMESDLGIDSIKRVEIMSGVQEKLPNAPVIQPDQLGKLRTLRQIIEFIDGAKPQTGMASTAVKPIGAAAAHGEAQLMAAEVSSQAQKPAAPITAGRTASLANAEAAGVANSAPVILQIVSEKTGYPTDMLNIDMDMESDLGIDSIKRVEIMSAVQEKLPNAPVIQPEQLGKLRTLRQIIEFIDGAKPQTAMASTAANHMGAATAHSEAQLMAAEVSSQAQKSAVPITAGRTASLANAEAAGVANSAPVILQIVSEKTGYPTDMLNIDMDMESDLGIDSIKRVEIMSAVQEKLPNAPVIQPEQLGKLRTLRQIIEFIDGTKPQTAMASTAANPMGAEAAHSEAQPVTAEVSSQAQKPAVPITAGRTASLASAEMAGVANSTTKVEKEAERTAPQISAFNLVKQVVESKALRRAVVEAVAAPAAEHRPKLQLPEGSTVVITNDGTPLAELIAQRISKKGFKSLVIETTASKRPNFETNVSALIVLAPPPEVSNDSLWNEKTEQFVKEAFFTVQAAEKALLANAERKGALLATVSRLDGAFALTHSKTTMDPIQGALAGLVKTASLEWPKVAAKAIDLDSALSADSETADLLLDELFALGPIEVGITAKQRYNIVETEEELKIEENAKFPLKENDVVLISGGARGVTAAVAVELARLGRSTLVLFGRSPEPIDEPSWLSNLSQEAEIKRALLANASGQRLTPKELEQQYRHVTANREILRTLKDIEAAGGHAIYRSVDIRDKNAVFNAVSEIERNTGHITALIHGAGVLRDRKISDKTLEQFDDVFNTKVVGLRNLLSALKAENLKTFIVFSSVTARYGRIGQADYAMANEALNKTAQKWALLYPECRVLACNWGPWNGGMVNEGLKKLFLEEGIGLVPLKEGALHLIAELLDSSKRKVEIVLVGKEGIPVKQKSECDVMPAIAPSSVDVRLVSSGENLQKLSAPAAVSALAPSVSNPVEPADIGFKPELVVDAPAVLRRKFVPSFERTISLQKDKYMANHIINGKPVLPMAMIIEWLADGALHENPGFLFHGFDELRILKGFVLSENAPQTLRVYVTKVRGMSEFPKVSAELRSKMHDKEIIHAKAEIVLAEKLPEAPKNILSPNLNQKYPLSISEIYKTELFHGPLFHGITDIVGWSEEGIACRALSAPSPHDWLESPLQPAWLADPLILDSAFQLMILWTRRMTGAPSLPAFAAEYRQYKSTFPQDGARIIASAILSSPLSAKADIEFLDHEGHLIAAMKGYECTINSALEEAFAKNFPEAEINA